MKYEIQKRSISEPNIWYTIALTDTRDWAERITRTLDMLENGEFRFIER